MKYLIVIDSDGTLRHSDGTISSYTKKTISKLVKNGHYVVICTARPRYYTKKIAEEVGASPFLISSNGSEIYNSNDNTIIASSFVPTSQCVKLYKYAINQDLRIVFVTENKEYVTKFIRNENQELLNDSNIKQCLSHDIKQIMIIGKEVEKILYFKDKVTKEFRMNVIDSSSELKEEIWFSVGNNNSSKGNAVIELSNYLGVPLKNTIAIGNDYNDLSMFKVSGTSVAVANALDEIKTKTDIITDSNDNDGVAKYLNKINEIIL